MYLPQTAAVFHPWKCAAGCPGVLAQAAGLAVEWRPAPEEAHDLPGKGQGSESTQQLPTPRRELVHNTAKS